MTDNNATFPDEFEGNTTFFDELDNSDNFEENNYKIEISANLGGENRHKSNLQNFDDSEIEFSLLSDEQTDIVHSAFKYSLKLYKKQKFNYSFDYMVDRILTIEKSIYTIIPFDPRIIEGFDDYIEFDKNERLHYEQQGDKFGLYPAKIFSSIAKILKDYLVNNRNSDSITGKWYYETIFHNLKLFQKFPRSKLIPKLQAMIPDMILNDLSYFFYGNELKVKLIRNYAPYIHLLTFSSHGKKFEFAIPQGDENCMCSLIYTKLSRFSELTGITPCTLHRFGFEFFDSLKGNRRNISDFSLRQLIEKSDLEPFIRGHLSDFIHLSEKYSRLYSTFYKGRKIEKNLEFTKENKLLFDEIRYLKPIAKRARNIIEKDLYLYHELQADRINIDEEKSTKCNIKRIIHNCNNITLPELQLNVKGIKMCICCFIEQMYSEKFGRLMMIKIMLDNMDKFDIIPELEIWNNDKVKKELFDFLNLNFE